MLAVLCIDSGNSRIKWGLCSGGGWLTRGALAHVEVGRLGIEVAGLLPDGLQLTRVLLANVAGPVAAAAITDSLVAGLPGAPAVEVVHALAAAGGVRNGYREPERLGVDRWCALIGARRLTPGPALVVMAGTATTVDSLTADGLFRGGLILPGIELMRRSLARDTAGLPFAQGQHQAWPQCTDDAIVTGILEAQAGAIERAWHRLGDALAPCLLSGGAVESLMPLLNVMPLLRVDDLPLEGLRILSEEC